MRPNDDSVKVISPLLHVATKLASEPQVRKVTYFIWGVQIPIELYYHNKLNNLVKINMIIKDGRMLQLLRGSEVLPWHLVHPSVYDNLMLWYVMSIDCLVILDHDQRHPLDSVILQ